jgi:hypothetical protein
MFASCFFFAFSGIDDFLSALRGILFDEDEEFEWRKYFEEKALKYLAALVDGDLGGYDGDKNDRLMVIRMKIAKMIEEWKMWISRTIDNFTAYLFSSLSLCDTLGMYLL